MTHNHVHRFASLLFVAFAIASIGGDGCFDWGQQRGPATNTAPICATGQRRWACVITVLNLRQACPHASSCSAAFQWTPCAVDVFGAQNETSTLAAQKGDVSGTPKCATLDLASPTPILNDLVPVDPAACTCDDGTGATCIPGSDPCAVCLNTCCAEVDACTAAGDPGGCCAAELAYWTGAGPACGSATDAPLAAELSSCWDGNGCMEACHPWFGGALHLHDGGLGFEGSGGAGGGSP